MNDKFAKTNSPTAAALLRRAAAVGSLALVSLLGIALGAGAQTPNDITVPTPYSWPTYHAGGLAGPYPFTYTPPANGTTSLDQPNPPSPLYSQLQGTPSGFNLLSATGTLSSGTSTITEVPSFLLGNYVPTEPPTEAATDLQTGTLTYFPNHFRDDQFSILSWSAPFTFLAPATSTSPNILNDNSDTTAGTYATQTTQTAPFTVVDPSGWTVQYADAGGWATQTSSSASQSLVNPPTSGTTPTYRTIAATNSTGTGIPTATWTFTAPTAAVNPGAPGLYSVSLHLPDPIAGEYRIPDAHYTIRRNNEVDANGNPAYLFNGRISQTETNNPQFLAGPFALTSGDTLKVTLDNSTASTLTNSPVVLADSVTLTPGAIAGGSAALNGSPAVINSTQFPEIGDALFYGSTVTPGTTGNGTAPVADNTNPYGNPTEGTPNPDGTHRIYQLVYFGRYETIVLTDAAGNLVDGHGRPTTVPVTQQVGAIYCVDGINGYVVWRFQTPDVLTGPVPVPPISTATTFPSANPSQAVFSTPSIARVNVRVNTGTASAPVYTVLTKLVVTVADNNGLVYCLDALGNRNGTSNTSVIGTSGGAFTYNQPVYNPAAGLNQVTTAGAATIAAHVGTTNAYWIYRPNADKAATPSLKNDLPIPLAFGLASPTIYTDPTVPIDVSTIAPGVTTRATATPPTLASNATVYIGNSNGTLYSLDAAGAPVTVPGTTTAVGPDAGAGDPYDSSHYIGILSAGFDLSATPTPTPNWWFSVNGDPTTVATAEGNASITSTPAIQQTTVTGTTSVALSKPYHIYFTTANDALNEGRVYSVLSTGPTTTTSVGVGGANYNLVSRPDWSFPRAYKLSSTLPFRPPLGSIHGSPAVFTNPDDKTTRVYVAADANEDSVVPADQGRIWAIHTATESVSPPAGSTAVNAAGQAAWVYPDTYDPNVYAPGSETKPNGAKTLDGRTITASATVDDPPLALGAFDYATPAVGIVQYPTTITYGVSGASTQTAYVHTDAVNTSATGINGVSVPMLYVGAYTEANDSSNFFALDLDGVNDVQRNIFAFGANESNGTNTPFGDTPSGAGFQSSPLLVVNSSATTATGYVNGATGQGNGGSVFITGSDNNIYQLSATPTSDLAPAGGASTAPQYPLFALYSGFGPFSSLAVSAFTGSTLGATGGVNSAVDWVYGGDSSLGIARGITPFNLGGSGAVGVSYGSGGPGPDAEAPGYVPQNFPLHTYLFDGISPHLGTTVNMNQANGITSTGAAAPLPVFEWGQPVYIRLTNVIPPNNATLVGGNLTVPTGTTGSTNYFMHDSSLAATDPGAGVIYTNGGPITIQLTDVDTEGNTVANGETDSVTIPATILPDTFTNPPGNGFLHRGTAGAQDGDSGTGSASGDMLKDVTNQAWLGAVTYSIGDGSNRRNTPGARRRIVSATQIAQAYAPATGGGTGYTFIGSVTLQVNVNSSANAVTRRVVYPPGGGAPTGGTGSSLQRIAPVDQPTFGILNPLAVRAAGYPLQLGAAPKYAIPVQGTGQLGPFSGIGTAYDLEAYENGNRVPTTVPTSGVVAGAGSGGRRNFRPIITATSDINHGTTGDNADPNNLNTTPPVGSTTGTQITETTGTAQPVTYGPYTLDLADRSALGTISGQIRNLTVQTADAQWHDNSQTYGPGAVVNAMPWEALPIAAPGQANTSVDYPNIAGNTIAHNLQTNPNYVANSGTTPGTPSNISNQPGSLDPATPKASTTTTTDRNVYVDPVQVQFKVPQFQPANLQLFDQSVQPNGVGITPDQINATSSVVFPQGYVTSEFVFVDSNHNHRYDRGEAYRQVRVFTGVPVDLSTAIQNTTVDLGRLPQSFGLQTEGFTATNGAKNAAGNPVTLGLFQPYPTDTNPIYPQFFRPLNIVNKGNVNLVNLHLDQKTLLPGTNSTTLSPLKLQSDALDLASLGLPVFPAYDTTNVGGPYAGTVASTTTSAAEQPYLLRSTLDPDLVTVYGRNPYITQNFAANYPGATAHKARVGATAPAVVSVPDSPDDSTQSGYLNLSPTGLPTLTADTNNGNAPFKAPPFIGLAVPLGTPVGTYTLALQAYEGLDPNGYLNVYNQPGAPYASILPPLYGGVEVNANTPTTPAVPSSPKTPANLNDSLTLVQNGATGRYTPLQPYSNPTVVKATVTEARITNGASNGDLPQVDAAPSGQRNNTQAPSSNFLPSAFRDPVSGNISTYWTSSPRIAGAATPYALVGANLSFKSAGGNNFFGAASGARWWTPITLGTALPTTGVNSGIGVFTDTFGGSSAAYALVQNVTGGGATPVTNNLLCFPVTASSGALTGTGVPVSQNTSQSSFGAHGLLTGTFPDAYPTNPQASGVQNNLWAFWYGGARGRSVIYYNSALASDVNSGKATAFGTPAALPIPAGLVSVSDPVAVETSAPDLTTPANIDPVIEVTYTGIAADGNADIYVSRYRPYFVRDAQGAATTQVALALLPSPAISEQLQATDGNLYYQARDVAWARNGALDVTVGGVDLGLNALTPTYDRASGQLVYTKLNVTIPGLTTQLSTVYVDLAQGRVRFGPQFATPQPVYATFNPQARRITTDPRADTAPVAFLDTSSKPNDLPNEARVPVDRYWYLWRKSGATGTSTTPTLFYKTQRLSIALHDAAGNPITPTMVQGTTSPFALQPRRLVVTDTITGNTYYDQANAGLYQARADIDVAHGRVYFPITAFGTPFATEGRAVTITVGYTDTTGAYQTRTYSDTIHWLDEPHAQSLGSPNVTTGANGTPTPATVIAATGTDDIAIPIDTITNESNVTAFLDPEVILKDTQNGNATTDVPHKVWLFWNSTRNGTADLYYETISPLFSATYGG